MKIQQIFIYKAQRKTVTRTVANFPLREISDTIIYMKLEKWNIIA